MSKFLTWFAAGLLGTTALPVVAAEVLPGGQLNITISGFARFLAAYGDLSDKIEPRFESKPSFDFRNEYEVHTILSGQDERTGLEYGGTLEFEADTNREENTDETWIFVRGGFGEMRFGDTDSAANNMKIGAYTIAVGTGGIDGTVVDANAPVLVDFSRNREDATKIIYYSPSFSGFQLGISYLPDSSEGDQLAVAPDTSQDPALNLDDVVTAGLAYTSVLGDVGIRASIVGVTAPSEFDETFGVYTGAAIDISGFSIAGGVGMRRTATKLKRTPAVPNPNDEDDFHRNFYNIGAAYQFDRYAVSVNYGRAISDRGHANSTRVEDLVFGAEVALMPGLVLSTEVAKFRLGGTDTAQRPDPDLAAEGTRRAWVGVTRLALSF